MNQTKVIEALESYPEYSSAILKKEENFEDPVILVDSSHWNALFLHLYNNGFDYLSFLSAIDLSLPPYEVDPGMPALPKELVPTVCQGETRFQVFAAVQTVGNGDTASIILKTDILEDEMTLDSIEDIFPGANWHERECWEMFGINFRGHDEIRHLYLPYEFEGNPLRKDFQLLARKIKTWPGLTDVEPLKE
jgi:NADH-quinone oxidoreductase subunit C